jgi:DHA1 family tetracycline resistance protein-like MFS transporter
MTQRVSPQEQGRLQGAIAGLASIAGIVGPTLFTQALAFVAARHVEGPLAGAPFLIAGVLVGLGGLIAWRATRPEP